MDDRHGMEYVVSCRVQPCRTTDVLPAPVVGLSERGRVSCVREGTVIFWQKRLLFRYFFCLLVFFLLTFKSDLGGTVLGKVIRSI